MAYTNRYIAIPAPPVQPPEYGVVEDELWMVRDTDDKKTLLGLYSKVNAERLARRLNADINLSQGERRALDMIAACYPMECSTLSIARAFKNSLEVDDEKVGARIVNLLKSHGLVTEVRGLANSRRHSPLTGAKLTEFGLEWLGR